MWVLKVLWVWRFGVLWWLYFWLSRWFCSSIFCRGTWFLLSVHSWKIVEVIYSFLLQISKNSWRPSRTWLLKSQVVLWCSEFSASLWGFIKTFRSTRLLHSLQTWGGRREFNHVSEGKGNYEAGNDSLDIASWMLFCSRSPLRTRFWLPQSYFCRFVGSDLFDSFRRERPTSWCQRGEDRGTGILSSRVPGKWCCRWGTNHQLSFVFAHQICFLSICQQDSLDRW